MAAAVETSVAAGSFINEAIDVYGYDDAYVVLSELDRSLQLAREIVPFITPPSHIKIGLKPLGGMGIAGFHDQVHLTFVLDTAGPADLTVELLPRVVVHESAHYAHKQYNARLNNVKHNHLTHVIHEGIALSAERQLAGQDIVDRYTRGYPFSPEVRTTINHTLVDLLCNDELEEIPRGDCAHSCLPFMNGENTPVPMLGYKVGMLIVGIMAEQQGKDLQALMETPYDEFKDFALNTL